METRTEYINRNRAEIEAEGIFFSESIAETLENEYYDEIIVKHIKAGGRIENKIYKDLTNGQQYHFNKFLNWDNDKVINSDYEQEVKKAKEQSDKRFKIYLQEQAKKQQKQEIAEQKKKQNTIQEIKQLQNSLFDYNNLSPIGKRDISKYDHELKQTKIKNRITEPENKISAICQVLNNKKQ